MKSLRPLLPSLRAALLASLTLLCARGLRADPQDAAQPSAFAPSVENSSEIPSAQATGTAAGSVLGMPAPAGSPFQQGLAAPGYKIADANYKILPSDILSISVFQEDDLKSLVRVASDGTITFPLVGQIDVKGMSPLEASQAIARKLAQGYLIDPQVTVTVMEFSKHSFTVLGQVQKPGSYDIPDQAEVTLLQAIGIAGGYTRIADPRKVTLMRKAPGSSSEQVFTFNAKRLAAGKGDVTFAVRPGDVITVAESLF